MSAYETTLEAAQDANEPAVEGGDQPESADLPELRGWEQSDTLTREDVIAHLRENFDPREYDPEVIRSITYSPQAPVDHTTGARTLGFTKVDDDGSWDKAEGLRSTIYCHKGVASDDAGDANAMRETINHEICHTIWPLVPENLRAEYTAEIFNWSQAHDSGVVMELGQRLSELPAGQLVLRVSDYSMKDANEHFCENMARAIANREEVARWDAHLPPERSRLEWIEHLRAAAMRERESRRD